MDVSEYPESGKVNISPQAEMFEVKSKVSYFTGEEDPMKKWNEAKNK